MPQLVSEEELIRQCVNEIKDVFVKMKYAITDVAGGTKAFNLLLGTVIDKYPKEVGIEACKELLTELHMNQAWENAK